MSQCVIKTTKGTRCQNAVSKKPDFRKDRCSRHDHQTSENVFEDDSISSGDAERATLDYDILPAPTRGRSRPVRQPASLAEPMIWTPTEAPHANMPTPDISYGHMEPRPAPDSHPLVSYGYPLPPKAAESTHVTTTGQEPIATGGHGIPVMHSLPQAVALDFSQADNDNLELTQGYPTDRMPDSRMAIHMAPDFSAPHSPAGFAGPVHRSHAAEEEDYGGYDWKVMAPAVESHDSSSSFGEVHQKSLHPTAYAAAQNVTSRLSHPQSPRTRHLSVSPGNPATTFTDFARASSSRSDLAHTSVPISRGQSSACMIQAGLDSTAIATLPTNATVARLSPPNSAHVRSALPDVLGSPYTAENNAPSVAHPPSKASSTTQSKGSSYVLDPRSPPFSPRGNELNTLSKAGKGHSDLRDYDQRHSLESNLTIHMAEPLNSTSSRGPTISRQFMTPPTLTSPHQNPSTSSSPPQYISLDEVNSLMSAMKVDVEAKCRAQIEDLARAFVVDKKGLQKRIAKTEHELETSKVRIKAEEKNRVDLREDLDSLERMMGELGDGKVRFGKKSVEIIRDNEGSHGHASAAVRTEKGKIAVAPKSVLKTKDQGSSPRTVEVPPHVYTGSSAVQSGANGEPVFIHRQPPTIDPKPFIHSTIHRTANPTFYPSYPNSTLARSSMNDTFAGISNYGMASSRSAMLRSLQKKPEPTGMSSPTVESLPTALPPMPLRNAFNVSPPVASPHGMRTRSSTNPFYRQKN